jgi:hypothetical protein
MMTERRRKPVRERPWLSFNSGVRERRHGKKSILPSADSRRANADYRFNVLFKVFDELDLFPISISGVRFLNRNRPCSSTYVDRGWQ